MRTRPPKPIRVATADIYRELSGLLVEAGCERLPQVVEANLCRTTQAIDRADYKDTTKPLNLNVSADVPTLENM